MNIKIKLRLRVSPNNLDDSMIVIQRFTFFKDLVRYPLAREGVYGPGGPTFLAHTKQKVNNILGLTALRLAHFKAYE